MNKLGNKTKSSAKSIGSTAEKDAEQYLLKQGLKLIQRNFSSKTGEIDLIMQDKENLVFVEVRYRNNDSFGGAAASVDIKKQRKLIKTAQYYLTYRAQWAHMACRFDIIAIQTNENKEKQFIWLKNAFCLEETVYYM